MLDPLHAGDAGVTKRGLVYGILYSLILGLAVSCCMVWTGRMLLQGIVTGCIGLAGVTAT